jgi:hypothetical protein
MTGTASGMPQSEELLICISSTSTQFAQEHADQVVAYHKVSGRRNPAAASGRVDLPQQPQENVAFIRAQSDPRIGHLDHLNIFPLWVQEKRKWTRSTYR